MSYNENQLTFKDKLLNITERVRFKFFKLFAILQMIPWDRIMNFLNQSGATAQIEQRVKDTINKPKI